MAKKQMEEMKKSDMAKPTEMKSTAGTGGPTKGGMK
jgi:hypothetical protein